MAFPVDLGHAVARGPRLGREDRGWGFAQLENKHKQLEDRFDQLAARLAALEKQLGNSASSLPGDQRQNAEKG
ncbi:MAG: hypothetical protein AAEI92_08740 [Arenicellales bacterium]